ncbi:MAG: hypothetical protein GKR93_12120 [Gammaproteobacteria bacterium]|nr:hypothetical protein [Gammaproteobacteria bacterium]
MTDTVKMSIHSLDMLACHYSECRQDLADVVAVMHEEQKATRRKHLKKIQAALSEAANSKLILKEAINANRQLFEKPKTQVLHGIKCGFRKKKGKLEWDDDDKVCERIKKNYHDEVGALVKTKTKPVRTGLEKLSANELKKLGVRVVGAGDVLVCDEVATEIDELIDMVMHDDEFAVEAIS